jgi:predicted RND superfamily exporter protein
VMTALTTATGVLSFLAAEMKPIMEMGLLAALGVGVTLIFSLAFLPAILSIVPLKPERARETPRVDAMLSMLAGRSARHPWTIIAGTAVLTLGALYAMTMLRVSSDPISWFPVDHAYRIATDFISDQFGGSYSIEV